MRRTLLLAIAAVPAVATSTLLLIACTRPLQVTRAAEPNRVAKAAHPTDPATYLPETAAGWSLEPVPADDMPVLDGMRIASVVMRPEPGATDRNTVSLSAIVFDGTGTDATMLPHALGDSTRRVDIGDETVWEVESAPGSCVAMWPTSRDVLVLAAATTCDAATAAMRSVLD